MRSILKIILLLLISTGLSAQEEKVMVKYTRDFQFNEGIYLSFKDFKNNDPSLTEFALIKGKNYGEEGNIMLKYPCPDSIGSKKSCFIDECFGFYKNGALYFSQGYPGYFYRMFIVGALSHFISFNTFGMPNMYIAAGPIAFGNSSNDFTEFLLDFETGKSFHFTYKEFSEFLKTHDTELYDELEKTKQKRKMIHHFLLKYNEKHPIYFPSN